MDILDIYPDSRIYGYIDQYMDILIRICRHNAFDFLTSWQAGICAKMHNGLWINLSDRDLGLQVAYLILKFYFILNANFLALRADGDGTSSE